MGMSIGNMIRNWLMNSIIGLAPGMFLIYISYGSSLHIFWSRYLMDNTFQKIVLKNN
jgi:hypothetical protein